MRSRTRDLEEMMRERGIDRWLIPRAHRWVLKYAKELDLQIRPHLQATNDSWRVDETDVIVLGTEPLYSKAIGGFGSRIGVTSVPADTNF